MSLLLLLRSPVGAPPVGQPDGAILEVQLTPGIWTDLTADVRAVDRIRWRRGLPGSGPRDRVASTGTLAFALDNSEANSGTTRGWYSPNHASVRAGWMFGIPCRLLYRRSDVVYPLWYGKIRTILPSAGIRLDRTVLVTAQDAMGDLADYRLREVSTQFNKSEAELLQTLVAALPTAAQPRSLQLDAGLDSYPFAYDDLGDGANGLGLATDVTMSALGRLYVGAEGDLIYMNRHTLARQASRLTLTDANLLGAPGSEFAVPSSLSQVFDRVRVTLHPKSESPTALVALWQATSVVRVPAGVTVTLWGTYTDANNPLQTVGGKDFETPAAYTNYEANTLVDGTGTDRTLSITVTAEAFASSVKFTIGNPLTEDVYLVRVLYVGVPEPWLVFRGRAIYDNAPLTVESVSPETYGDRPLDIDLPYQSDPNVAQDFADYLRTQYLALANQAEILTVNPHQSAGANFATMVDLEIGDVMTVSETMTGLNAVPLMIQAIEGELRLVRGGAQMLLMFHTAPSLTTNLWILEDAVASVLEETTVLGWA